MKYRFLLIIALQISSVLYADQVQKEICVVIPSYNNSAYYERNLSTVLEQKYDNFSAVYIDDCSTDGTGQLVEAWLHVHDHKKRVKLIKNSMRRGALANYWHVITQLPNDVIVVQLDGDDWFAHDRVLERINREYQDQEVWMTYGQYCVYPTNQIGHCRAVAKGIIDRNEWRSVNLLLPFSHLRTFYAGLFQHIKLDDLLFKNRFFPLCADVAMMYPMLEMAQFHVRFINEILYVYNQDNPLNDYKNQLQMQLAFAQYISKKKKYDPLPKLNLDQKGSNDLVDIIIFSFDRPMQLYALLESLYKYMEGMGKISVLYRTSTDRYDQAYAKVKNDFPSVHFVQQLSSQAYKDFKQKTMRLLYDAGDYVLFGVDDIIVKDYVNLSECIALLKRTHAYGFYLRLGKNITKCYFADAWIYPDTSVPAYLELNDSVCVWQFKYASHDWRYPNTLDMTVYRKSDIIPYFIKLNYHAPNSLEARWAGCSDVSNIGICFADSKVVNLPLNMVQDDPAFKNGHMNFSKEKLLELFNNGVKIDIQSVYRINNASAHIDFIPSFIQGE